MNVVTIPRTRRRGLLAFLTASVVFGAVARSTGAPPDPAYPDHSNVMVYRDARGEERPVRTRHDWSVRSRHILAGLQDAMGPLPTRDRLPPLDVKVVEESKGENYRRLTLTFAAEAGDRVPADLYLPVSPGLSGKRPAVLALHQTSAAGKRDGEAKGHANLDYPRELARRGYVVLAPDYPSFGDYRYDFHSGPHASGSLKGIFNHMRCVDLLQSRPEVDPTRVGVIGHSLGGHNAMFVAAFDDRIKVIVSSCGWTPFHDYYGGNLKGWSGERYMPRIDRVYRLDPDRMPFDFYEVVAALAPRPFLSVSPVHDTNFEVNGVRKAIAEARKVYELLGVPDHLRALYPDCGHDFPPEARRAAYGFIDAALGFTPARQSP